MALLLSCTAWNSATMRSHANCHRLTRCVGTGRNGVLLWDRSNRWLFDLQKVADKQLAAAMQG
jgi:hypothetical protein